MQNVLRKVDQISGRYCRGVDRVAQTVQRLALGWTVRGSNTGRGEIFRTSPDRPCAPPSLLYNGYRIFHGGKERPERDADTSPPSSAAVMKEQNYTSTPPMGRTACTKPQCLYNRCTLFTVEAVMGKSCPLNSMSLLDRFIEFLHLVLQQWKQDQFQLKLVSIDLKSVKKSNFLNDRLVTACSLKDAPTMNVATECLPLPFLCQHRLQLMHSAICCPVHVAVLTLTYIRLHTIPEEEM